MTWQAEIVRWEEDEAEIRVTVGFWDDEKTVDLPYELIVKPAGTPQARILEEVGRVARSARANYTRNRPVKPLQGRFFRIDDL